MQPKLNSKKNQLLNNVDQGVPNMWALMDLQLGPGNSWSVCACASSLTHAHPHLHEQWAKVRACTLFMQIELLAACTELSSLPLPPVGPQSQKH